MREKKNFKIDAYVRMSVEVFNFLKKWETMWLVNNYKYEHA